MQSALPRGRPRYCWRRTERCMSQEAHCREGRSHAASNLCPCRNKTALASSPSDGSISNVCPSNMLKKFIAIKNVGRFRNSGAHGDIEFRKLSLVYSENGRGKTTLCSILRSLQTNDPAFINERKTADATGQPQVDILTEGGKLTFKNGKWSQNFPKLAIFDSTYVAENVYSGDYIELDHKRRLYQITVGEDGVKLAEKVQKLDGKSREEARKITEKKNTLTKYLPKGITLEAFVSLSQINDVETKIAAKQTEIEAVKNVDAIKTKPGLAAFNLPSVPAILPTLLAKTIDDLSQDAESRIYTHVDKLGNDVESAIWLSDGVPYIQDDACPFCNQSVTGNELIEAYKKYFSAEYTKLKYELSSLQKEFQKAFDEKARSGLETGVIQSQANQEWWSKYVSASWQAVDFEKDIDIILQDLYSQIDRQISAKIRSPLEPISLDEASQSTLAKLEQLRGKIATYNHQVVAFNSEIEKVKKNSTGGNLPSLQLELAELELNKTRHSAAVNAICQDYETALADKSRIETEKEQVKKQLDIYTEKVMAQYQDGINKLLERFSAGFRLGGVKHQYLGGIPSSTFSININGVNIDLGDAKTPRGVPCFRSTMRSGDRNTLALAFFLVQLNQRTDLADLTVVFDDPFTSLDRFRQHCTRDQIRTLEKKVKQVIVFSHEPSFLKLVSDGFDSANLRLLALVRAGVESTDIREWNMKVELALGMDQDIAKLSAYYHGDAEDLRGVIRCIRPVMEHYIRSVYPGHFAEGLWLGNMIEGFRDAASGHPLCDGQATLSEVEALNDYTKRYHHDDNTPVASSEPIQDVELQGYVARTLKYIKRM